MSPHESDTLFSSDPRVVVPLGKPEKNLLNGRAAAYPLQLLYFTASFIALISLCHCVSIFYQFAIQKRVYDWKRRTTVSLSRVLAAVIDSFRILVFRWTIPVGSSHELNLAEIGLTLGYIAVLFSWSFVDTTTSTGVIAEANYYSDRAGRIVASQLPIMIALGMKNNIISWLTGVSFSKLNFLHRMAARVLCVLIWTHAAGRVELGLVTDDAMVNPWVRCGILAATSLTLLSFLAVRPIRQRNYEVFLVVHFILGFVTVSAAYVHVRGRDLPYYGGWPSMVLLGLEYFVSLVRLALVNFGYLNPWSSQSSKKEMDAVIEVLSPDFLRVTMHRSRHFHWRPGQNAYLSFPSLSTLPFESHPFTILTIDNDDSTSGDSLLIFIFRVRKGFTRKLLQGASSDQTRKVFLNGPYGSPPLLFGYQTVILIAGGSGVTFTQPLFLDIMCRAKAGRNSCQKIVFIWAIRDSDNIHWIANILAPTIQNVPSSISVSVQLYVTAANNITEEAEKWDNGSKENGSEEAATHDSHSSTMRSYSVILQSPFVELHQGRPDFKMIISKEVADATGRVSVNVCGPRSLANSARAAIRSPRPMDILWGGPTTTLHVEAFGGS